VGGGCSVVSTPVAALSATPKYEVPQISFASTSTALSDNTTYPFFKRTIVPDVKQASVAVDIVRFYRWKRVGILYSQHELHSLLATSFEGDIPISRLSFLILHSPSKSC